MYMHIIMYVCIVLSAIHPYHGVCNIDAVREPSSDHESQHMHWN